MNKLSKIIITIMVTALGMAWAQDEASGNAPHAKGSWKKELAKRLQQELLQEFDKDGDGKLNAEEKTAFHAACKQRKAEMHKKFDKNGDGKSNAASDEANPETA